MEFPYSYFEPVRYRIQTEQVNINNDPNNPSAVDYVKINSGQNNEYNTMGIHSRGSGDAAINKYYKVQITKPIDGYSQKDTIRRVEEMILDEMALETCFEGYRFGDLMRISMHRAADTDEESGYDTEFFADRVASRDDATVANPFAGKNSDLWDVLKGDGGFPQSWFLRLNTAVYY